jgi:formamidopyrimidine-DNA glycosylase
MPELPDVESFRRSFARTSLHRRIARAKVPPGRELHDISPRAMQKRLKDRRFVSTSRHGKVMFAKLDRGGEVYFHFGMTGYFVHDGDGARPPKHARLTLDFTDRSRTFFVEPRRFGRFGVTESARQFISEHALGPDALDLSRAALRKLLQGRRMSIKAALMDQHLIAGVGNVYSDEILFQARTDPRADVGALQGKQVSALHRAMRHVLKAAIAAQAQPDRLPKSWLLRHRRRGEKCPGCGGAVRPLHIAGRNAWFCPRCQGGR